jgi:hypothetical protein
MNNKLNTERGQAIVLIALALIGLIAFAGLAIDGGMVYSDRRHAQNASDAGSLAGGGAAALNLENQNVVYTNFTCGSAAVNTAIAQAVNSARNMMLANEYAPADITVTTECQDSDPTYFQEKYIDIQTQIITDTQTALIHVVYDDVVQNLVNATTRVKPRTSLAFGHAVVGLNPGDGSCDAEVEGVKIGGTGEITISGGGIWSQSCLAVIGDCNVEVDGGGIGYGDGQHGSCDEIDPAPQHQNDTLPADSFSVPTPDCSKDGAVSITQIKMTNGDSEIDLNASYPGANLICITSPDNAIQISNGTLSGTDITLYLPNSGDIRITGGVINLSAAGEDPDPDPGLPGVLIYVPHESVIKINGTNDSHYMGLIYAPESGIEIEGSGDIGPTMNTQIIGYNVSLLGNATIEINYNESWNYEKPSQLDLQE